MHRIGKGKSYALIEKFTCKKYSVTHKLSKAIEPQ